MKTTKTQIDANKVGKVYGTCARCKGNVFLCSSLSNYYTVCNDCSDLIIIQKR